MLKIIQHMVTSPATATIVETGISASEYLEREKDSEIKHEFYHGQLIPMAGEKKKANRIGRNILRKIELPLMERGFDVFFHDVKAAVSPGRIYRYPDLVVAPTNDNADEYLVLEPVIAVEVASEDSKVRDTGRKRGEYTSLPSMGYYLIVYQEEMMAEIYTRNGDKWEVAVLTQPDDVVAFPKFSLEITLAEIYLGA